MGEQLIFWCKVGMAIAPPAPPLDLLNARHKIHVEIPTDPKQKAIVDHLARYVVRRERQKCVSCVCVCVLTILLFLFCVGKRWRRL